MSTRLALGLHFQTYQFACNVAYMHDFTPSLSIHHYGAPKFSIRLCVCIISSACIRLRLVSIVRGELAYLPPEMQTSPRNNETTLKTFIFTILLLRSLARNSIASEQLVGVANNYCARAHIALGWRTLT